MFGAIDLGFCSLLVPKPQANYVETSTPPLPDPIVFVTLSRFTTREGNCAIVNQIITAGHYDRVIHKMDW